MFQATQRHRYHDSNRSVGVVGSRIEDEVGHFLDGGTVLAGKMMDAWRPTSFLPRERLASPSQRRKGARTTPEQYPPRSDNNNNNNDRRLQGSGLIEKN